MGVSRLPNGLGFVKPGATSVFTAGDQTPDVKQGSFFVTAASALTITNFDNGELGQVLTVVCNTGGAVTIQNSAGGINIVNMVISISAGQLLASATAGSIVMLNKEAIQFYHNGTDWSQVGTRIVDTTQ